MPSLLALTLLLAAPHDELVRYVPDEAGFCIVGTDLGTHAAALADSPFAAALRKSPVGHALARAKEWEELKKFEANLSRGLGVGLKELADVVPGECVVFAYQPGPPERPEKEMGLFLLRARNAKALATLIDKFHAAQKDSGELRELVACEYRGVKYVRRVERKETNAYLLRGPVLVFSGQEEMLKRAIDREASLKPGQVGWFGKRLAALDNKAAVHVLLNARAFDAGFAAGAKKDAASKTLGEYWKALDGVEVSLAVERDVRVTVSIHGDPARLPPAGRRYFAAAMRASDVWAAVPEAALFAVCGRLDLVGLYAVVSEFTPPETREASEKLLEGVLGAVIGKSIVREVFPAVGPDWGVYATSPPDSREVFPRVVVAVKAAGGGPEPVDEAMLEAVHWWARAAVVGHNKMHPDSLARIRPRVVDKTRVRVVEGLAAGVLPTYGLRAGFLLVTTHPDEVGRFNPGKPAGKTVPVLRLSLTAYRDYLKTYREPLAELLAARDGTKKDDVLAHLDAVREVIGLFTRLDIAQESGPGRATFALTLKTAEALRK